MNDHGLTDELCSTSDQVPPKAAEKQGADGRTGLHTISAKSSVPRSLADRSGTADDRPMEPSWGKSQADSAVRVDADIDKTIRIETKEHKKPLPLIEKSWQDRFRRRERESAGLILRAWRGGTKVARALRRALEHWNRGEVITHGETRIDSRFVHEEHHHAYKKPWCLGRDQFDYLLSRGLQPEHRVLDFGCGAMRVGIWLVAYLNTGRYFGIDPHYKSLEAAVRYEVPLHGLAAKQPRLLCDDGFACEHFGESFDFVLAFSVFNWLGQEETCRALEHVCSTLKPDGRIVVYGDMPVPAEVLQKRFGLTVGHRETMPSKFFVQIREFTELIPVSQRTTSAAGGRHVGGEALSS